MAEFYHSVRLDESKCLGCTNCIKRCPTGAIRVRNGKAHIIKERCIDCGECIKVCPHHAKYAEHQSLNQILEFKHRIAIPAPSLYGQFNNLDDVNYVLTALKSVGFDDVYEVSRAAELVSDATRRLLAEGKLKKPAISSACPAICRLIRVAFPKLIDNVVPLNSPMEVAASLARKRAVEKGHFEPDEVGVFFITPCPAKLTAIKQPICLPKSNVNGAIAIKDIYPILLRTMDKLTPEEVEDLSRSGIIGVSWSVSGGESSALLREHYLAADGIENVIQVLDEVENGKLHDIDFIELNACTGGCVGGSLTAENPFIARARLQRLRKHLPVSCSHLENDIPDEMYWKLPLVGVNVMQLADNVSDAMTMMNHLEEILNNLPGLDCGTCGAPSCRDLADDIVRGYARESDCIFNLRNELTGPTLKHLIPAPFRTP